jgi:hypothetical protein
MSQRTEPDATRPRECLGDQQIWRRARLPDRGEVLADPGLFEAEGVEALEIIEIPALAIPDAPLRGMRRHEERTEPQERPPSNRALLHGQGQPQRSWYSCKIWVNLLGAE